MDHVYIAIRCSTIFRMKSETPHSNRCSSAYGSAGMLIQRKVGCMAVVMGSIYARNLDGRRVGGDMRLHAYIPKIGNSNIDPELTKILRIPRFPYAHMKSCMDLQPPPAAAELPHVEPPHKLPCPEALNLNPVVPNPVIPQTCSHTILQTLTVSLISPEH